MMTVSLVISIVCVILFLIFTGLLCILAFRKKRLSNKPESDSEHAVASIEECSELKPPRRKRGQRFYDDEHFYPETSPKPVPVPFNSPNRAAGAGTRKYFQPMNFDEKTRRRREKRRKRKEEMRRENEFKVKKQRSVGEEYFRTKVHVTPLKFSETNYTKNRMTEKLFAGSLHIGYSENETTQENSIENVRPEKFTSWRDLFDEKMKTED